jgi:hypothetical protein
MHLSDLRYFRMVYFLIALMGVPHAGFARERGPRVEVVCPLAPNPVRVGDKQVLAYELHVTNFDRVPLTLTSIEVSGDGEPGQPLRSVSGAALSSMMIDVGAGGPAKEPEVIAPGSQAVIFLWIELPVQAKVPRILSNRMVFRAGSAENPDSAIEAVLNDFQVAVSQRAVPVLNSPFRGGIWVAGDGPANDSPHRRALLAIDGHVHVPERFASDWVKVGPNGDEKHGTARNEDYWAYGEPVLAVADGEVTGLNDGIPDNPPHTPPKQITLDNILGNYITLRIGPSDFVTYAHLRSGSLKVALHQHVTRGAVIGMVGDSGQATAPHLHMQVTDGSLALESEGIPFVFRQYVDLGPGATFEMDKHLSMPRGESLPEENEVVEFGGMAQSH